MYSSPHVCMERKNFCPISGGTALEKVDLKESLSFWLSRSHTYLQRNKALVLDLWTVCRTVAIVWSDNKGCKKIASWVLRSAAISSFGHTPTAASLWTAADKPSCTCHSHCHVGRVEELEYLMVINVFKSKSDFLKLLESELEACHCWDIWWWMCGFVVVLCWSCTLETQAFCFGLSTMRGCDPAYSAAVMQIVCHKHGLFLHQVQLKPVATVRWDPFSWKKAATLMNYASVFLDLFLFIFASLYPEVCEGRSSSHWEILLLCKGSVKITSPLWIFQGKNPEHLVPRVIQPSEGCLDHWNIWTYWIHRWNLKAVLIFYNFCKLSSMGLSLTGKLSIPVALWLLVYAMGSMYKARLGCLKLS